MTMYPYNAHNMTMVIPVSKFADLHVKIKSMEEENARLKAEVERLKKFNDEDMAHIAKEERKSSERLEMEQADVERLTKAGDELHAFLINYIVESRISSAYLNKLDDAWNAAKEGKPSA
jgi:hypothetical protein